MIPAVGNFPMLCPLPRGSRNVRLAYNIVPRAGRVKAAGRRLGPQATGLIVEQGLVDGDGQDVSPDDLGATLTYLRRLQLMLSRDGVNRAADDVMTEMRHLHSVLLLPARTRKPSAVAWKPRRRSRLKPYRCLVGGDGGWGLTAGGDVSEWT